MVILSEINLYYPVNRLSDPQENMVAWEALAIGKSSDALLLPVAIYKSNKISLCRYLEN